VAEPTLQATIPGVPESVNHSHGYGRGRAWRTASTDSWLNDVIRLVRNKAVHHKGLRFRWKAACSAGAVIAITMTWHRPDTERRDSSNVIKVLEDGIATALDIDDEHFEWTTRRAYDARNPRVELTLTLQGGDDGEAGAPARVRA